MTPPMKRMIAAAGAVALVIAAVLAGGCHDYNKDANALIEKANNHVVAFSSMDASVQAGAEQLSLIALTPSQAKKALSISDGIKKTLAAQKAELEAAAADLAKIRALKVSDEMKQYAALQIAALDAQIKVLDEGRKLYDEQDKIFIALRDRTGTTRKVDETLRDIEAVRANIDALHEQAAAAQKKASDYFDKNLAK